MHIGRREKKKRESIYAVNSIAGPLERERTSWVH